MDGLATRINIFFCRDGLILTCLKPVIELLVFVDDEIKQIVQLIGTQCEDFHVRVKADETLKRVFGNLISTELVGIGSHDGINVIELLEPRYLLDRPLLQGFELFLLLGILTIGTAIGLLVKFIRFRNQILRLILLFESAHFCGVFIL